MKSVRNIYKIGIGPSSSHTMGPAFAAERFLLENPGVERVVVTLYGSLSKTGKGHGTDRAIIDVFEGIPTEVIFNDEDIKLEHPNTLNFKGYIGDKEVADMTVLSVGGGEIEVVGEGKHNEEKEIYKKNSFTEIAKVCKRKNIRLSDIYRTQFLADNSFRMKILTYLLSGGNIYG